MDTRDADTFIANVSRPLSSYAVPPELVRDIARGMSQAASARTGFQIEFTPDLLRQLTPLTFVQLLRDWRLLSFRRDPDQAAAAATP